MAPRDFYWSPYVLHVPTKCHTSRSNVLRGLLRWNFVGGAIEPICHSEPIKSYSITTFRACNLLAKFAYVSSIFSLSKWPLLLTAKTASPRQRRSTKLQKLHDLGLWTSCICVEQIWYWFDLPTKRNKPKYKDFNFLLPVGGAMTMIQNWPADVFRPGV